MVDALILNYNDYDTTKKLASILNDYSIINHICIVDNNSSNDSYIQLRNNTMEKVEVIKTTKNGGYGYGNNYGINYLKNKYDSEYILLCNPDIYIENGVIEILEDYLKKNNDCMIVAPLMLNNDGIKQRNSAFKISNVYSYILSFEIIYSKIFKPEEYKEIQQSNCVEMNVDAVAGSLFMFNVDKMIQFGMYDENVFLYCEERILGLKCKRAGLKITLLPQCNYIHYHSVSINKAIGSEIKKKRILIKSALYVIKNYYRANRLTILFGRSIFFVSIIECLLIEIIKRGRLW